MDRQDRKAALAAYKERKTAAGIYALLCRPTGQRWAGRAADLSKIQNRVWFSLRQNGHTHRGLQAAWNAHGAEAFAFEELERIEEEPLAFVRDRLLKDRLTHWCGQLAAEAI
ncbi:MAG: GIY-YIG nuclease family protein [Ferrovibrio sp.]